MNIDQVITYKATLPAVYDALMQLVQVVEEVEKNVPIADRTPVESGSLATINKAVSELEGLIVGLETMWEMKQPRLAVGMMGDPTGNTYAERMKFSVDLLCRPNQGYFNVFARTVQNNILFNATGRNRVVCLEALVDYQKQIKENVNWIIRQYNGHMAHDDTPVTNPISTTGVSAGEQMIMDMLEEIKEILIIKET
jgi:hypothetical protein